MTFPAKSHTFPATINLQPFDLDRCVAYVKSEVEVGAVPQRACALLSSCFNRQCLVFYLAMPGFIGYD
jgi:hypothetical protein